ncbi:MAG: iron chelate uptake ABC transporter family permease subunit [Candidatus Limisoma sp.]|nr:iron ABC transporter permease [Muribaculaceae bacterium]MDD6869139.1 iron ABC transporter permease [bacterium]MDY5827576.1 iron ABC transporter permease [Candidatus Limisoma sp.]
MKRYAWIMSSLAVVAIILAGMLLAVGTVDVPFEEVIKIVFGKSSSNKVWEFIIIESRIPLLATAALSGAALAVCGLLLQTLFGNPLADPSILGVSTGAGLGAGCVMLSMGTVISSWFGSMVGGFVATLIGAFIGAMTVMLLLLLFSSFVKSSTMLLIVGVLIGYVASSAISLLNFFATEEGVHSYVIWGLGNFSGVTLSQLPLYSWIVALGLVASLLMIKPLNALLLGRRYAENLGVNLNATRNALLTITGVLTAIVTSFCGPIGFIGLVVPHISRLLLHTSDHYRLIPATMLTGAVVAMLCTLLSVLPMTNGAIPINAITPIIGVPVIIYVIVRRNKIFYFN